MRKLLVLAACGGALAVCVGTTPYPNFNPIPGARVSANPFPRGSAAFCDQYARQSAANAYEDRIDRGEDGFGQRFILERQARRVGDAAYRRCLDGRTG